MATELGEITPEWPYGYGYCCCGCGQRTGICTHTVTKEGRKKGELLRFRKHHWGTRKKIDPVERFWPKVNKSGGPGACWPYTGYINQEGYGQFSLTSQRAINAHRYAYIITNGPLEEGMKVCHKCDNPPCCNPAHLFEGTAMDNVQDMINKGRKVKGKPNPNYGESHHNHLLSSEQIDAIRDLHEKCGWSQRSLARVFNARTATIHLIVHYRSRING